MEYLWIKIHCDNRYTTKPVDGVNLLLINIDWFTEGKIFNKLFFFLKKKDMIYYVYS